MLTLPAAIKLIIFIIAGFFCPKLCNPALGYDKTRGTKLNWRMRGSCILSRWIGCHDREAIPRRKSKTRSI